MSYARPRIPALAGLALAAPLLAVPGLHAQSCSPATATHAPLPGIVRDADGALPLPGAAVRAIWNGGEAEATTGPGGAFTLCDVPRGVLLTLVPAVAPYRGVGVAHEIGAGPAPEPVTLEIDFARDGIGQIAGRIVGLVLDRETGEPVANALVGTEERGFGAVTNAQGAFALDGLFPTVHVLRVRHLAYGETEAELSLSQSATLEVEIRLAPAVLPVEPIHVTVLGLRSPALERAGFYERREWNEKLGLGHYLTRSDIELRNPSRVSHVLTDAPGVGMLQGCTGPQCSIPLIRGTSPSCRELKSVGPELAIGASLYVNGQRTRMAVGRGGNHSLWGVDELLKPGDIAGIEIYSGLGDLPGEFADSNAQRCGAVVIWTGV